jgi:glutamyl-tRNA reductase
MPVFLLGINHKTAPVEVRETLALPSAQLPRALRWLRRHSGLREIAILSTCNRAEIYGEGTAAAAARLETLLRGFQSFNRQAPAQNLHSFLYRASDGDAARHLFRVAGSLDSLVLGESEILGQVKTAHQTAQAQGTLGETLDALFRRAIACGKRARTETAIGRGALNVGSAAVELARGIFGPLVGHTVLILGAGKMSSLTAQYLASSGARRIIVANRTYAHAQELAQTFAAEKPALSQAVRWEEFPRLLREADIVIASTRAPHLILDAATVATAMKARRRPLFLIDIAVPRDIDPEAHRLPDVYLYDIDDLQAVVEANRMQRADEIAAVEAIVESEVAAWEKWHRGRDAQPVLAALAGRAAQVRDAEVEEALARLPDLSPREREVVRAMGKAIAQKLMHPPLRHLREAAARGSSDVEAIARAFALESGEEPRAATPEAPPESLPESLPKTHAAPLRRIEEAS